METIILHSLELLHGTLEHHSRVLLIVSRNACPGCEALAKALEHNPLLHDALVGVTVVVAKVEQVPEIAPTYKLRQAPTMILFHYGVEVTRLTGFTVPAPLIEALYRAFESIPEADASGLEDTGDD